MSCSTPSERAGSVSMGQGFEDDLGRHSGSQLDYDIQLPELEFKRSKQRRRVLIDEHTQISARCLAWLLLRCTVDRMLQ